MCINLVEFISILVPNMANLTLEGVGVGGHRGIIWHRNAQTTVASLWLISVSICAESSRFNFNQSIFI